MGWRSGRMPKGAWLGASAAGVLVVLAIITAVFRGSLGLASSDAPTAIPCFATGTPPARDQSPILHGCAPVSAGTPVTAGDLTVTLSLSSDEAAPQDLLVEIHDEHGQPVDDATVTVVNRHLEMDHGDFVHGLNHVGSGQYGARVGMGMGGRWQTEIVIERPGHQTVSVYFLDKLKGLQ